MPSHSARTAEGDAATAVVLEIFRVNGLVLASGSQLAAQEGLTAARWQVMGAVALAEARDNLDHHRSPLIALTERGRHTYAAVDRRQIRWINELSAGLQITDLAAAAGVLRELGDRLERANDTAGQK